MEAWDCVGHVETAGASWTGARFGDENVPKKLGAYEAPGPRGIGIGMERHVEKGGSSWTGVRFGDEDIRKPPMSHQRIIFMGQI